MAIAAVFLISGLLVSACHASCYSMCPGSAAPSCIASQCACSGSPYTGNPPTASANGDSVPTSSPPPSSPKTTLPGPEDFSRANDECMLENGLNPEFKDLLVLENFDAENVPESILCTIKCANERLGFLRPDGTLDVRKMFAGPPLSLIDRWKIGPLTNCLVSLGKIRSCRDMLKKEQCMIAFDAPKPPNVL